MKLHLHFVNNENINEKCEIDGCECEFCCGNINLKNTFYKDKFIKVCEFCNIIINFEKKYTFCCILCNSSMKQRKIIKKTIEKYNENKKIPLPNEIDENVKFVEIPVYLYAQFIERNPNYKIFFTCGIENYLPKIFANTKSNIYDYFNIEKYVFDEFEKNYVENEIQQIKNNEKSILLENKELFYKKINHNSAPLFKT